MPVFVVDGSPNAFVGVVLLLREARRGMNLRWPGNFGMQGCQASKGSEFYVGDSFRKHLEREDMLPTFSNLQIRAMPVIASVYQASAFPSLKKATAMSLVRPHTTWAWQHGLKAKGRVSSLL